MLYILKAYDNGDAIIQNTKTGSTYSVTKKQILSRIKKTPILGVTQIDDNDIDLEQISIIEFASLLECEEYIYESGASGRMTAFIDETDGSRIFGVIRSRDLYHVKYVVYTILPGCRQVLYVRDDGKYTPYEVEALDLSETKAKKKAAGMTKVSRNGYFWSCRKVHTSELVR